MKAFIFLFLLMLGAQNLHAQRTDPMYALYSEGLALSAARVAGEVLSISVEDGIRFSTEQKQAHEELGRLFQGPVIPNPEMVLAQTAKFARTHAQIQKVLDTYQKKWQPNWTNDSIWHYVQLATQALPGDIKVLRLERESSQQRLTLARQQALARIGGLLSIPAAQLPVVPPQTTAGQATTEQTETGWPVWQIAIGGVAALFLLAFLLMRRVTRSGQQEKANVPVNEGDAQGGKSQPVVPDPVTPPAPEAGEVAPAGPDPTVDSKTEKTEPNAALVELAKWFGVDYPGPTPKAKEAMDEFPVLYFSAPTPSGIFTNPSESFIPGSTLYEVHPESETKGRLRFSANPESLRLANSIQQAFHPAVCELANTRLPEHTTAETTEDGVAIKQDGQWKVVKKVRIRFQ